ncbi:MAG: hypothetical protein ACI3ZS_02690 [Candidatus Cryptobacteroides sp.]
MKNITKIFAALAASVFAFSCTPEYTTPDKNQIPEAGKLTPVITVDQATNYVTFSIKETGVVPMWIFGEDKVDGKANKKYSYTGNGISLRIREAGVHTVELKAYNKYGVSLGSQAVEYTLENTYRDPFDPAPHMKKLAGEWMWNSSVDGHFGCGPDFNDPKGWWAAGANEKADWSLYNDTMAFTEDGKYSFNPGEDGKVYVNAGFTQMGGPQSADFLVDIPAYETTYTIENNWNDAGIEEIWLVLPEKKNLSYIPNDYIYNDPRFLVLESKAKKSLKLAANNAPNGDGTISWLYDFVPAVKVATPEELLAGTDGNGKAWVMDSAVAGHIGCGWNAENAAGWWSAKANEKADYGMYDDVVTFYPDGKYVYDSGEDGKMYINKEVTRVGPGGASEDFDVDQADVESTYTFDGEKIVLASGTPMVYVSSDAIWDNPEFIVTEITETTLKVVTFAKTVGNPDGIAWQMIFKARDIQAPSQSIGGVAVEDGKVELSLTKGQTVELVGIEQTAVDIDWFKGTGNSLTFLGPDGDYRILVQNGFLKVIPLANGETAVFPNAIWIIGTGAGKPQGTEPGWNTGETADIPLLKVADNTYKVTLYMTSPNFKLFEQPNWGDDNTGERVWLKNRYAAINGNGYLDIPNADGNFAAGSAFEEGWYTITCVDTDGTGALDVTVDKMKQTVWDPTSPSNLWLSMTVEETFWHYAPGWNKIANPELTVDGNCYSFTLAEATTDQWQAQFALKTNISTSAAKHYDFSCKVLLNNDHPGVTIKLVKTGDDDTFYCQGRHAVTADEEFVYQLEDFAGIDMDKVSFFFDFGGNAAGTNVVIKDILFQEHRAE